MAYDNRRIHSVYELNGLFTLPADNDGVVVAVGFRTLVVFLPNVLQAEELMTTATFHRQEILLVAEGAVSPHVFKLHWKTKN